MIIAYRLHIWCKIWTKAAYTNIFHIIFYIFCKITIHPRSSQHLRKAKIFWLLQTIIVKYKLPMISSFTTYFMIHFKYFMNYFWSTDAYTTFTRLVIKTFFWRRCQFDPIWFIADCFRKTLWEEVPLTFYCSIKLILINKRWNITCFTDWKGKSYIAWLYFSPCKTDYFRWNKCIIR